MSYGLTAEGFVPKTFEIIVAEITAEVGDEFGASVANGRKMQRFIAIFAAREALTWELGEAIYNSDDPDAATGARLEALCALTGTLRELAFSSEVVLTLTGTPATNVSTGARASVESTGKEFETIADGLITALTAWASTTVYAVGDRRTNASRCYVVITAGTSAGSGGPTTDADDITDGTVHWRYMGEGTGAIDVAAESLEDDAIVGISGDVTEIETPVAGWSSVINLLDAEEGSTEESDASLRPRREEDVAAAGKSTAAAIREDIGNVAGVTAVHVFVNNTGVTDVDGVPPNNVEVLVQGGADAAIRQAIWDSVAGGIGTHGTETGTIVDEEGTTQTVKFSRPSESTIWVELDVYYPEDEIPDDAADTVAAAIVARGELRGIGYDANTSTVIAAAMSVAGVTDTANVTIGVVDPPVGTTPIPISRRGLATWDTSRITVNALEGAP